MTVWRIVLALLLALAAGAAEAQTFPPFTGFVVDAADVLPANVEQDLTAKLDALQRNTKRQLVVATVPDLQGYPIEDYGYRLGRAWRVGLGDVDNGAILLVAPSERKVRIEVGYGLEPIVTDALASAIVSQQVVPRFREGDLPGGVVAGADALIRQLRASPEEAQARLDAAVQEFDRTRAPRGGGGGFPASLVFWGLIFLFVVLPLLRGKRRGRVRGRRYRGGGSDLPIMLWAIGNEIGRSRGGWGGGSSGGGFGGGWGGGGFSGGGGGSFGGGGASGSW